MWFRQIESAPKVASPVVQYNSPKNVAPTVNQNHKPQPTEAQTEVDGGEVTQKKTFVFEMKTKVVSKTIVYTVKGTVSPPERCDFVSVKLEKVHELFQVCRICGKGVVFYNMAQYGLLHHKSLCN